MQEKIVQWTRTTCAFISRLRWLPPLIARITVGVVFAQSGWGKIHGIENVINFFTDLGIPAPVFQAYFVSYIELLGGLAILFGILTRVVSVPLIVIMAVALVTAKREDIETFVDIFGLSEFLYIVILAYLLVDGPGCFSIDAWFCRRSKACATGS
jgi:putative oxidoreductase